MQQIQSYNVFKYKSGIIQLTITTKDRWVPYRRVSGTSFAVQINEDSDAEDVLEVPELVDSSFLIITNTQEKDSIYFYFIPVDLVSKIETFSGEKKV